MTWCFVLFFFAFFKSWDLILIFIKYWSVPFKPVSWWSTSVSTLHTHGCEKKVHVCSVYTLHCRTSELWFLSSWIPCLPAHAVLIRSALWWWLNSFPFPRQVHSWRSPRQEHEGMHHLHFCSFICSPRGGWWGGHGFWPIFNTRRGSCEKLLV